MLISDFPPPEGVYRVIGVRSVDRTVDLKDQHPLGVLHHTNWGGREHIEGVAEGGFPYYASLRVSGVDFRGDFLLGRVHIMDDTPTPPFLFWKPSTIRNGEKFLRLVKLYFSEPGDDPEDDMSQLVWHCDRLVDRDVGLVEYDTLKGCYIVRCRKPSAAETARFVAAETRRRVSLLRW